MDNERLPEIDNLHNDEKFRDLGNQQGVTMGEALFVSALLADPLMCKNKAAFDAGYKSPTAAYTLLKKDRVLKAIEKGINERIARTLITQDRIVNELEKMGFADVKEILNVKNGVIEIKNMDSIANSASIESIKQETYYDKGIGQEVTRTEIKMHSKLQALKMLGEHLGMFTKKLEVKGLTGEVPALVVNINKNGT